MFLNWSSNGNDRYLLSSKAEGWMFAMKESFEGWMFAMKEAFFTIFKVVVNVSISKYPYTTFLLKFFNLGGPL